MTSQLGDLLMRTAKLTAVSPVILEAVIEKAVNEVLRETSFARPRGLSTTPQPPAERMDRFAVALLMRDGTTRMSALLRSSGEADLVAALAVRDRAVQSAQVLHYGCKVKHQDRLRVFERDGYRCYLCGCQVSDEKDEAKRGGLAVATLDHVLPRHKGGSNAIDNLRTCCKPCNEAKADMLPMTLV